MAKIYILKSSVHARDVPIGKVYETASEASDAAAELTRRQRK